MIRCDTLEDTCKRMLRDQEHPKHAIKDDEDFNSTQVRAHCCMYILMGIVTIVVSY